MSFNYSSIFLAGIAQFQPQADQPLAGVESLSYSLLE